MGAANLIPGMAIYLRLSIRTKPPGCPGRGQSLEIQLQVRSLHGFLGTCSISLGSPLTKLFRAQGQRVVNDETQR